MKRYSVRAASGEANGKSAGELDWSTATCLTDFAFPWETTPAAATEFRALWSRERLYFRFDCRDDDLVLSSGATEKERVLGSDRVEIFLTPDLGLQPYFCLEMAPSGDSYVYRARTYRQFDDAFAIAGLEVTSKIEGERSRYRVEGSLPLTALGELGVLKADAREFFAGLYRAEFSRTPDGGVHFGWMSWVDPQTPKPDFHVPGSFGVFELVD
jgi:Carbohydrate family 9 binding domain-like